MILKADQPYRAACSRSRPAYFSGPVLAECNCLLPLYFPAQEAFIQIHQLAENYGQPENPSWARRIQNLDKASLNCALSFESLSCSILPSLEPAMRLWMETAILCTLWYLKEEKTLNLLCMPVYQHSLRLYPILEWYDFCDKIFACPRRGRNSLHEKCDLCSQGRWELKIAVRLCGVCLSQFVRFAVEELKTVLIFLCGRGTDSLQSNDDSYSCAIVPRCKIIRKTGKPRILHQTCHTTTWKSIYWPAK